MRGCVVSHRKDNNVMFTSNKKSNVNIVDSSSTNADSVTCPFSKASTYESWLWHKKLAHLNFKIKNKLVKKRSCKMNIKNRNFSRMVCVILVKWKSKRYSFVKLD